MNGRIPGLVVLCALAMVGVDGGDSGGGTEYDRGREPGLRRRRQQRRHLHARLHRALQSRRDGDQPQRLVGAVRGDGRHELAAHEPHERDPPARPVLPRPRGAGSRREHRAAGLRMRWGRSRWPRGAGKVALVSNQDTLQGSCPTAGVVDFVGYGPGTNCSEGAPDGDAEQHHRRAPSRRRLHRHRPEQRRLRRGGRGPPQHGRRPPRLRRSDRDRVRDSRGRRAGRELAADRQREAGRQPAEHRAGGQGRPDRDRRLGDAGVLRRRHQRRRHGGRQRLQLPGGRAGGRGGRCAEPSRHDHRRRGPHGNGDARHHGHRLLRRPRAGDPRGPGERRDQPDRRLDGDDRGRRRALLPGARRVRRLLRPGDRRPTGTPRPPRPSSSSALCGPCRPASAFASTVAWPSSRAARRA